MHRPFTIIIVLSVVSALCGSSCQNERNQEVESVSEVGKTITRLSIRYVGEKTVSEERLRVFLNLNKGKTLSHEQLDEDIRSLYESGLVDDVKFVTEPDGVGVHVIAQVKTRPESGPVLFIGNTHFSDRRLALVTKPHAEKPMTIESIQAMRSELVKFYKEHGFNSVKVMVRSFDGGRPKVDDYQFVMKEGNGDDSVR